MDIPNGCIGSVGPIDLGGVGVDVGSINVVDGIESAAGLASLGWGSAAEAIVVIVEHAEIVLVMLQVQVGYSAVLFCHCDLIKEVVWAGAVIHGPRVGIGCVVPHQQGCRQPVERNAQVATLQVRQVADMEIDAVAYGGEVRVGMEMDSGLTPEEGQAVLDTLAAEGVGVRPPIHIAVVDMQIVAVLLDVVNDGIDNDVAACRNQFQPTVARRWIAVVVAGVMNQIFVAGKERVDGTSLSGGVAGHGQCVVIDIRVGGTGEGRLNDIDAHGIAALRHGDDGSAVGGGEVGVDSNRKGVGNAVTRVRREVDPALGATGRPG